MTIEEAPQNTLRDTLESNFEAADAGTLPTPEAVAAQPRDEVGRFAGKQKEEVAAAPAVAPQAPPQPQRPSTWKKDYWGHYDKLAKGEPLAPEEAKALTQYINQRENEYKTGVSTYRTEAQAAKDLQEGIAPYLPELQANGIAPGQWVRSMAQAHYALAKGTPEQKLQVFQGLARQFGVPLGAIVQQAQGQAVPQFVPELMQQQQAISQQVNQLLNWRQQQEMAILNTEVSRFQDATKYPHFEAARETMAQLLERGLAPDLEKAYEQAIWLIPEVREQLTQAQVSALSKPQVVAQARARAVSPKSATPSAQVATAGPKDRRSQISELVNEAAGGRV